MKPSASKTNPVARLLAEGISCTDLPDFISLADLEGPISDLHRFCFETPGKQSVEWGGCIIVRNDRLHMPNSHWTSGYVNGIDPACSPADEGQDHQDVYVGFAHTHPWVSGLHFPGFSAMDFCASLADGNALALACNGPELFALIRTSDRTLPPQTELECEQWDRLYRRHFKRAMKRPTQDAVWSILLDVNCILCEKTGYALYSGYRSDLSLRLIYRPIS